MFFPVAGIEIAPWIPFTAGFFVAFMCSMGGVSGANLLLPFQMSVLGFVTPAVSATNHLFNILAIPSGVYRYVREGRMPWALNWVIIAGALPGVIAGVVVRVHFLPDPSHFKVFAGIVLLYIGLLTVRSTVRSGPAETESISSEKRFRELVAEFRRKQVSCGSRAGDALPGVEVGHFGLKSIDYIFYGERLSAPTPGIFLLSGAVGVVGGIYGIGGGAIMAPILVTVFGLPVYTVAGPCLLATFATSSAATIFYQALSPFYPQLSVAPDWKLGMLMGAGGMLGMYAGARVQKFVPAEIIKWLLALILIFSGGGYMLSFF